MSTEPLTPDQVTEIEQFAQAVTAAWGSRRPDLSDFLSTAADQGARVAREHVPALIAEIGWLAAELADEKAEHEDTTAKLASYRLLVPQLQQHTEKAQAEAAALQAELVAARKRIAELEPRTGVCGHESPYGRTCELQAAHLGHHRMTGDNGSEHSWMRTSDGAQ